MCNNVVEMFLQDEEKELYDTTEQHQPSQMQVPIKNTIKLKLK